MSIFRADKKFEKFEDVTPDLLKKEGVRLLLCDLDNFLYVPSTTAANVNQSKNLIHINALTDLLFDQFTFLISLLTNNSVLHCFILLS